MPADADVPPRLIVSRPAESATADSDILAPKRRRSQTESSAPRLNRRTNSHEWTDIEESSPRRKRSSRKKKQRHERSKVSSSSSRALVDHSRDTTAGSESGRYYPRLDQIQEDTPTSRLTSGNLDDARHSGRHSRRHRQRDDISLTSRRATKHRVVGLSKRTETVLRVNPSLLSVLSCLTRASERSSSSSNTITQQSYDRRHSSSSSKTPIGRRGRSESDVTWNRARSPSVFDYMERSSVHDGQDGQSVFSSSPSSRYEPSDAGSSELPSTPSSHSTYPSPSTTRAGSLAGSLHGGSVAELRRRYDPKFASSPVSATMARSDSHSPESSFRAAYKQPQISQVQEDEEDSIATSLATLPPSQPHSNAQPRSSSRSSTSSRRSTERMHRQVRDDLRQHIAQDPTQHHVIDPVYAQRRSNSTSSTHSTSSVPGSYAAQQTAMQQYQYPSSPAPIAHPVPHHPMYGHLLHTERPPPAPEPPDLTRKSVVGYELLAQEFSNPESGVKSAYRRFEYLNHRLLLHLQDELQEMEEQLRILDEIAAQTEASLEVDGAPPRRVLNSQSEIHRQRTALLGWIFQKQQQYSQAFTAYNAMLKDCAPAMAGDLVSYREFMEKHAPLHESEARFLAHEADLVVPGRPPLSTHIASVPNPSSSLTASWFGALPLLPVALMLPLLLFSIIPTLAGRLAVTALLALGAFMMAATTRLRELMPLREWAVCGAVYVLLMAAIAGCVPVHGS